MNPISNKIDAHHRSVSEVLDDKKYSVDYFQREYKWEKKHIEQLVSDLTSSFLNDYSEGQVRTDVEGYNSYFLGPFVLSTKDGRMSIIDGQQRLTSLTLLLIYLNNLQKEYGFSEKLDSLIYADKYGEKSFNIQVDGRTKCLDSLFRSGFYDLKEGDDVSTENMKKRYDDVANDFPEELKGPKLPFFIDWLKYKVILVEINAYTDENAYTIFETMNDRGLSLSPTEMLKSLILSTINNPQKREKANELWKTSIQTLQKEDKDEDQRFIKAWFRAKYAQTIRLSKAGSINEDFEKIGTQFHRWFRDNKDKIEFFNKDGATNYDFLDTEFKFFLRVYLEILNSGKNFNSKLPYVYYIKRWGIAESLSHALLLAPLKYQDSTETVLEKMNLVAMYIDNFVVRRSVNYRLFSSSSIAYTMNTMIKEIRDLDVPKLRQFFKQRLSEMSENLSGLQSFRMKGQNKIFVKFLLSRMTSFIEQKSGLNSSFDKFYYNNEGKPFEVEHIWADKFEEHKDEFQQVNEFKEFRNRIGGLILLPRGTNQSFSDKSYTDKLVHYVKENLLAQSLSELTYQNNPNFLNTVLETGLSFKSHASFRKEDLEERQNLYQQICEMIWSENNFQE